MLSFTPLTSWGLILAVVFYITYIYLAFIKEEENE